MNIILIGMMGCGKSTCGQLLAQKLGRRFVDTDALIEQREGRSIPDIFAQEGENYFRDVECAVVRELSRQSNLVVATGGGIVLRAENVAALRNNGYVVWLNRSPEEIYEKVSMSNRPLGQGGKAAFLERFAQRESLYRAAAHLEIPSQDTPRATVELLHRHWLEHIPTQLEDQPMQVALTNTTQKLCVIGDPIAHTKSPLIQNTMLRALGLDYLYMAQYVPRGQAEQWLQAAKTAGYAGFNATMPHKIDLLPLMDELDEDARLYGAVNTVALREGKAFGYNTDGRGFLRSLLDAGICPEGRNVVILGAGGAAKSVALKLAQQKAASVCICNRTVSKAEELCAADPTKTLTAAPMDDGVLRNLMPRTDLLINCTSLGMTGVAAQFEDLSFLDALPPHAPVCDLIYSPPETLFLEQARLRGHQTLNGLSMLMWQAIFALEQFTNTRIDGQAMKAVLAPVLTAST